MGARLHFDKNGHYKGYSDSLEDVVVGRAMLMGGMVTIFLVTLLAPIVTYLLIGEFKNAREAGLKPRWDPKTNPAPFIGLNILWVIVWTSIIVLTITGDLF